MSERRFKISRSEDSNYKFSDLNEDRVREKLLPPSDNARIVQTPDTGERIKKSTMVIYRVIPI